MEAGNIMQGISISVGLTLILLSLLLQGKEATVWDLTGRDSKSLDYSSKSDSGDFVQSSVRPDFLPDQSQVRKPLCVV